MNKITISNASLGFLPHLNMWNGNCKNLLFSISTDKSHHVTQHHIGRPLWISNCWEFAIILWHNRFIVQYLSVNSRNSDFYHFHLSKCAIIHHWIMSMMFILRAFCLNIIHWPFESLLDWHGHIISHAIEFWLWEIILILHRNSISWYSALKSSSELLEWKSIPLQLQERRKSVGDIEFLVNSIANLVKHSNSIFTSNFSEQ